MMFLTNKESDDGSGMLDHIFTAPGNRNPKIASGAWEKYVSQFTVNRGP